MRAAVRRTPIERFHAASTDVLRGAVLGEKQDGKRAGREFEENGLVVYDVEVLSVAILDEDVETLLTEAQRGAITAEVARKREAQRLEAEQAKEAVTRAIAEAQTQTLAVETQLEAARRALAVAKAQAKAEVTHLDLLSKAKAEAEALELSSQAKTAARAREAELDAKALADQTKAFEAQMAALAPELIATLKALGNQQLAAALTENLSPLAILGGESVADVAARLLSHLPLGPGGADAGKTVPLPAKRA